MPLSASLRALSSIALLALLAPVPAQAESQVLAAANDLYVLIAETTMVTADQEPDVHAEKAREAIKRLDASLPAALNAVAGKDPEVLAELKNQWADLKSAFEGRPYAAAFRENTYDINLAARYTSGSAALQMAFDKAASAEAARTPVQALRLRVLKTVTTYLQTSTGIVGGTAFSANDQDNDLPTGVAAVDKGLADLKKQFAGDKAKAEALQRAAARWQFLRPTLLKGSGQATPYIVYMHGLKIVQALGEMEGAAK